MKDEHITAMIWAIAVIVIVYILAEKFGCIRTFVSADGVTFGVEATNKHEDVPEIAADKSRTIEGER